MHRLTRITAFLSLLFWTLAATAATYAYRTDDFSYDTPSTSASSVTWHSGTDGVWTGSPACTSFPNGDDDWADISFPGNFRFTFGGVTYSTVRVYSNGSLVFGTDNSGYHRDYTSEALPITAAGTPGPQSGCTLSGIPVNIMLVYWLDIVAGTANSTSGASVQYEMIGASPDRRFVISWVNVKLYNQTARYNFQVALYESAPHVNGNFKYNYTNGSSNGSGATVGVQLTTTDYTQYSYNQTFIDTTLGTTISWYPANQLASKAAEYRFDENAWNGTDGEVKDTSGSLQDAVRVGNATNVANGKLCRGGSFTNNTSSNTIDAVATPIVPGDVGAIDLWFNSNTDWTSGNAMLLDATKVASRPFFLMRRSTGSLRFVVTDSSGTSVTANSPTQSFAAGTWHHIGVSWNVRAGTNQTTIQIFIDGVLANGAPTHGTTNGNMAALSSVYIGDNRSTGVTPNNGTPNGANGLIDEVYFYPIDISAPQAAADMALTRPTCNSLDHFHIVHGGTQSACGIANITVEAHDVSHGLVTLAGTTMSMATSTGHGTWSRVATINPINNGAPGNGTYTFSNESQIVLGLADNVAETLNINLVSGAVTEHTGSAASCVSQDYTYGTVCDADLTFTPCVGNYECMESGLTYNNLSTTPGARNPLYMKLAGTDFKFDVVALQADGAQASSYTASSGVTVELFDDSASPQPACSAYSNAVASQAITFAAGDNGRKTLATNINLSRAYRKLRCRVADTNLTPTLYGCSSDDFAVRPQSILSVTSNASADNGGISNSATPAIKAGTAFSLAAKSGPGYDGTPKIDAGKIEWIPSGAVGTLGTGTISGLFTTAASEANANTASGSAFTYSEVGYFRFQMRGVYDDLFTSVDQVGDCIKDDPTPANDFSNTLIGGKYGCKFGTLAATNHFGRFYPHHFAFTPNFAPACAASGFTYMDQPFNALSATIHAENAANVRTGNYKLHENGTYNKNFAQGTVSVQLEDSNNGAPIVPGRLGGVAAPGWSDGNYPFSATHFTRLSDPDGPYNALDIGLSVTDETALGAAAPFLIDRDMDSSNTSCTPDAAGTSNGTCVAKKLNSSPTIVRYGRAKMDNAIGSDTLDLKVPFRLQYWSGTSSGWRPNDIDSCSSATIAIANGTLAASSTCVQDTGNPGLSSVGCTAAGPTTPDERFRASNFDFNLWLKAPVPAGSTGFVTLTGIVPSWLQFRWTSTMLASPIARATFGRPKSGPVIYRRERY